MQEAVSAGTIAHSDDGTLSFMGDGDSTVVSFSPSGDAEDIGSQMLRVPTRLFEAALTRYRLAR